MDQDPKYHAPTNLCTHEEFGTLWKANLEEGIKVWVQTSKDSTKWVRLGEFLEACWLKDQKSFDKIINLSLETYNKD